MQDILESYLLAASNGRSSSTANCSSIGFAFRRRCGRREAIMARCVEGLQAPPLCRSPSVHRIQSGKE